MSKKMWVKDSEEDRETVMRAYFYAFHQDIINQYYDKPFTELTILEMKQGLGTEICNNVYSIEYTADAVICRLLSFIFTHTNKLTDSDEAGVKLVLEKDMVRNFNESENSFFIISVDVIMQFYQQSLMASKLTKEETDNYDLDLINLFEKYGSAKGFKFDDKLSHYII
jgi:hypothetical protein